jgi:hypothetical protein
LCVLRVFAHVRRPPRLCRWKSAQDAELARKLHELPDVREPLPRAEIHRRQELLRAAVQPLRSWMAIYLKVCREAPYGLDLAHVLKTKLGSACRQHMAPLHKKKVHKQGSSRSSARVSFRVGAGANADEQAPVDDACASPLVLAPSEDDALQSPWVLPVLEGNDGCDVHPPCALEHDEMCLWH